MKKPPADKKAPAAKTTKRKTTTTRRANVPPQPDEQLLRDAVAPYLSLRRLQHLLACSNENLRAALLTDDPPPDVQAMLHVLAALLRPDEREPVTRAADVAALLLVEMSGLAQEQVRVVCLSAQHRIQTIHTVYHGTLHSTGVRLGEIFREPLRRNSAAIILVHNHPSGDLTPSEQDLLVTREATFLGRQLDIPVLDHIIIGHGQWLSMGSEYPIQAG
jgi:DNA repair protein RadC